MSTLKTGSRGPEVTKVQHALNTARMKPRVDPNGKFDARTEEAVRAFQTKNKLKVDGMVGKNTMKALMKTANAAKMDVVSKVPDYAPLMKKKSKTFIARKTAVLKVILQLEKTQDPKTKKLKKEYGITFRNFVSCYDRWRTIGIKIIELQARHRKELGSDPWSAEETKKLLDSKHAEAAYEMDRCDTCEWAFDRMEKMLKKSGMAMAA